MKPKKCCHCGATDEETRPYGPGGKDICFDCGMKSENKGETKAQLGKLLAVEGPLILTDRGPKKL